MNPQDEALDLDLNLDCFPEEVEEVLSTLRALMARVSSPVVRACLEEAHDDIAHLAGSEDSPAEDMDQSNAA
jgi:hypothetical protein